MLKVLVPVDGSTNSRHAVRHVLGEFKGNPSMDIHLLNVQPPFSRHITRFVDRKTVNEVHREASERALQPIRQMLDEAGARYSVHLAIGDKASSIADAALQLRCDHIVIGTARKNWLIRTVEGSVTTKVLELTTVPVVAIAGDPPSTQSTQLTELHEPPPQARVRGAPAMPPRVVRRPRRPWVGSLADVRHGRVLRAVRGPCRAREPFDVSSN